MTNVASAVVKTPVEIWAQIFKHLLDDPLLFSVNPFHTGCNYHNALHNWQDYPRLLELSRQRATLRLVSRRWKDLVDSWTKAFYAIPRNLQIVDWDQLRLASRLYLDPERSPEQAYEAALRGNPLRDEADDILDQEYVAFDIAFAKEVASADVLVISDHTWSQLATFHEETGRVSKVQALEIAGICSNIISIPTGFSNLTFLGVKTDVYRNHLSLSFPRLNTLIFASQSQMFRCLAEWKMPQLQHVELEDIYSYSESPLQHFLSKPWFSLLSLKLYSGYQYITFPVNIWDFLPRLEYLGLSEISEEGCVGLPKDHPLTTIGNIETTGPNPAGRFLLKEVAEWKQLRVFADRYRWEDLAQPISKSFGHSNPDWDHTHLVGMCELCIENIVFTCKEREIRYEDIMGRSLDEYRAGVGR